MFFVVKNFAGGGLLSFLNFNLVHDFIHYLCANGDKCCKKIDCGGLSAFLYFNFANIKPSRNLFQPTPLD